VKAKTADVVVIFGALESLLHNLAKRTVALEMGPEPESPLRKFQQLALDLTRSILEDHIRWLGSISCIICNRNSRTKLFLR
jgi:hypothetical protein